MENEDFQDDGRVVADMSGLERRPLFLPRFRPRTGPGTVSSAPARNPSAASFSRDERRTAVRGALTASLLIGAAFIGGLGVLIAILQLFWN